MILITLYVIAGILLWPLIVIMLIVRCLRGKEVWGRLRERFGIPTQKRPEGYVIWVHAASVGETRSVAPLVTELSSRYPQASFCVTTATITAAQVIATIPEFASKNIIHQFLPVDSPITMRAFLDYWRPCLILWLESELWPVALQAVKHRKIPTFLVNARMSDRSYKIWHRFPRVAKKILSSFDLILAQSQQDQDRLATLSGTTVNHPGNLKYAVPPLQVDQHALQVLLSQCIGRPCWIAASTHPGEEEIMIRAHQQLKEKYPQLLTFLAPRHPHRADAVTALIKDHKLCIARRSQNAIIDPATDIYLIDTMGELGLFYALCSIVCVGGSFVAIGGHNIIEPAHFGAAIVVGPHMENFREVLKNFSDNQACAQIQHSCDLSQRIASLFSNPQEAALMGGRARECAHLSQNCMTRILQLLIPQCERVLRA